MIGGRNIQNDIINFVLSISLIVLAIGLILFLVENKSIEKIKIILFATVFLIILVAISICMFISRQDIISIHLDKRIMITSILLISIAFSFLVASIIIIKSKVGEIDYIITPAAKVLYIGGVLGLLGASLVNLCKNTHRVSVIGIPAAIIALSMTICCMIL